jgi:hypothetical protein
MSSQQSHSSNTPTTEDKDDDTKRSEHTLREDKGSAGRPKVDPSNVATVRDTEDQGYVSDDCAVEQE